jgi:GNAT superfamily N-acetyltransferase
MSDPIIRPLTLDDLDGAFRLSTCIGWNQRLDDWRMLLRLAPAGAFAAVTDAHEAAIVGTAIAIDYDTFAWIAMMLVDPAWRGRGIGRRLLEAAMNVVASNAPVRLDATSLGRPLYQRFGFEDEATLSRQVRDVRRKLRVPAFVRPLTDTDLAVVIAQDRQTFGGTRGPLLEWAFRGATQYAHTIRSDDGVMQYCLGRPGRLFDQIGPVVANDDDTAHALVCAALAEAGERHVVIDAFHERHAFAGALRADGFVVERPLVRMCRRPRGCVDESRAGPGQGGQAVPREFAILGPEFA